MLQRLLLRITVVAVFFQLSVGQPVIPKVCRIDYSGIVQVKNPRPSREFYAILCMFHPCSKPQGSGEPNNVAHIRPCSEDFVMLQ